MGEPVKSRRYDNSGRAAKARATRRRILDAAREAVIQLGYPETTLKRIADDADVSVEAVYKHFGTKRALMRELLDVSIAGDDEPVPMVQREEALAIAAAPGARDKIALYARYVRGINERMGPLPAILLGGGRSVDADLRAMAEEADAQRLIGARIFAGQLHSTGEIRCGLGEDVVSATIWTLNSHDVYRLFTVEQGRSGEEYESLLAGALIGALLSG